MAIDKHVFGAIVAAVFFFLSVVQGICTLCIIYPMMLAVYCLKLSKIIVAEIDCETYPSIVIASHNRL